MLPLSAIAGEADSRRAIGARPPTTPANSPYTDIDECESPSNIHLFTPRYQPRSMPSPPLGSDGTVDANTTAAGPASSHRRSTSRLHGLGLNVFKHGMKTSSSSTSPSSSTGSQASTPTSPSKSKRRSIGFLNGQVSGGSGSPSSKHARHSSSHAFANYGPRPPISPTLSDARPPTAGHARSHSHQSAMSPKHSSHRGVQSMYSNTSSPRINLDNWTESYLNNRARGHKRNGSNRGREYQAENTSESSQSEAGSPSYTHMELMSGGMREVDATVAVAPILQARLSSMYSVSSCGGREADLWSTRSTGYSSMSSVNTTQHRFGSMEPDESELLELEEMMSDMNSSETSAEREIRMLMKEMLAGQEVVRSELEVAELEVVPSPMLPQLVEEDEHEAVEKEQEQEEQRRDDEHPMQRQDQGFDMTKIDDWQEIERWAGVGPRTVYPRESSVITYDRSEIDDESMHEEDFERLELETAMARMSTRSSRHPAEYEGLNEMAFDLSIPMPDIPEVEVSTPKQQYAELEPQEQKKEAKGVQDQTRPNPHADLFLGLGVYFEDLSIVDEELRLEEEAELRRAMEDSLLKAAALELPGSRPSTKDGYRTELPQLSLLGVPSPSHHAGKAPDSPTSGEDSSVDMKGKAADKPCGGRRHNLKDNEIRVEDPAYLVAFKKFLKPSVHSDAFVCRQTRFDAFQTRRICNELPHEYRPLPSCPPDAEAEAAKAAAAAAAADSWHIGSAPIVLSTTPEQRRAKEVNDEITSRLWVFMASRWLHYGRILVSPAHDILNQSGMERRKNKSADPSPTRRRVLDLGGAPVADWGWHCAYEYPHSKVYTVTSRPKNINIDNLPFPDNHFDVISARSLHTILKRLAPPKRRSERRNGNTSNQNTKTVRLDEYSLTLRECYRVLKPGGHFEWPRLRGAGFAGTKRAWTILPMAPPANKPKAKRTLGSSLEDDLKAAQEEMQAELKAWEELGVVKGSTKDVAALTGILGTTGEHEWVQVPGRVDEEAGQDGGEGEGEGKGGAEGGEEGRGEGQWVVEWHDDDNDDDDDYI
ncbi:hypothetical protein DRE_04506 [Drechslerella stenobrocha 248]|uniref:Uncharacterized protein n=1 Tax=Drechslerella stenobrocha 248 TaxID=1043628 RepID=W7IB69_9PEZI|nr:hypothetical protein DRE_04506 [Drechslerella stenobrocha 248]